MVDRGMLRANTNNTFVLRPYTITTLSISPAIFWLFAIALTMTTSNAKPMTRYLTPFRIRISILEFLQSDLVLPANSLSLMLLRMIMMASKNCMALSKLSHTTELSVHV